MYISRSHSDRASTSTHARASRPARRSGSRSHSDRASISTRPRCRPTGSLARSTSLDPTAIEHPFRRRRHRRRPTVHHHHSRSHSDRASISTPREPHRLRCVALDASRSHSDRASISTRSPSSSPTAARSTSRSHSDRASISTGPADPQSFRIGARHFASGLHPQLLFLRAQPLHAHPPTPPSSPRDRFRFRHRERLPAFSRRPAARARTGAASALPPPRPGPIRARTRRPTRSTRLPRDR